MNQVTFFSGHKTYTAPLETLKLLLEFERTIENLIEKVNGLKRDNLALKEVVDSQITPLKEASIHDLVYELSKRNEGCVIAIQCQDEKNRYEFYLGEKDLIATGGLLNLLNARMKLIIDETILAEEDGDEVGSL